MSYGAAYIPRDRLRCSPCSRTWATTISYFKLVVYVRISPPASRTSLQLPSKPRNVTSNKATSATVSRCASAPERALAERGPHAICPKSPAQPRAGSPARRGGPRPQCARRSATRPRSPRSCTRATLGAWSGRVSQVRRSYLAEGKRSRERGVHDVNHGPEDCVRGHRAAQAREHVERRERVLVVRVPCDLVLLRHCERHPVALVRVYGRRQLAQRVLLSRV